MSNMFLRNPVSIALLMVFLGATGLSICHAETTGQPGALKLSTTFGKAPLTVHVVGPDQLVRLGVGQPYKWVGCGMYVNWGDGPTEYVVQCSQYLEHTYKAPGVFTVTATIWHTGPDDSPKTDWEDTVKVTIRE